MERYLNLCYGDPLFARNPSLGAEGTSQSRPGPGKECRYLHFHVQAAKEYHSVQPPSAGVPVLRGEGRMQVGGPDVEAFSGKSKQWINCDLRSFDYSVLGQYVQLLSRLSEGPS
jgi:mRNA (2'-O-methyladenosine-N6-)-methyltransferase